MGCSSPEERYIVALKEVLCGDNVTSNDERVQQAARAFLEIFEPIRLQSHTCIVKKAAPLVQEACRRAWVQAANTLFAYPASMAAYEAQLQARGCRVCDTLSVHAPNFHIERVLRLTWRAFVNGRKHFAGAHYAWEAEDGLDAAARRFRDVVCRALNPAHRAWNTANLAHARFTLADLAHMISVSGGANERDLQARVVGEVRKACKVTWEQAERTFLADSSAFNKYAAGLAKQARRISCIVRRGVPAMYGLEVARFVLDAAQVSGAVVEMWDSFERGRTRIALACFCRGVKDELPASLIELIAAEVSAYAWG